jgi:hypothetical protein
VKGVWVEWTYSQKGMSEIATKGNPTRQVRAILPMWSAIRWSLLVAMGRIVFQRLGL